MKPFDIVAIGDITTDAFIRIKDAHVTCNLNREDCELCLRFGDKIPYESVTEVPAVGNAPNAAVAAARLGLSSALVADLGDDDNGRKCLDALRKEKVGTPFVKVHGDYASNYHYVLWYEEERTILVKHHDYPYQLPDIGSPRWVYLSSLGESSRAYHKEILAYLLKRPDVKLAFQPGTFQIKLGYENLRGLYDRANAFFCNKEEAQRILKTKEEDVKTLLERLFKLGPDIVAVTDGIRGAYAFDGQSAWMTPMYPDPKPPVDRTGAGDAFASTFVAALVMSKTVPEALEMAPVNSMSVVQEIGAQKGLLKKKDIETYLAEAPSDYRVREF